MIFYKIKNNINFRISNSACKNLNDLKEIEASENYIKFYTTYKDMMVYYLEFHNRFALVFLLFQKNRIQDYIIEKPLDEIKNIEDIIFNELLLFLNINPNFIKKRKPTPPLIKYLRD
jgi:hypothetical protein